MEHLPEEFAHKFVAVLNKKIEPGKLFNALGHMTAGLVGGSEEPLQKFAFVNYTDADEQIHPNMSHYNYVVLSAKNSNQIYQLRLKCKELGIPFTDFVESMTIGTTKAQQEATQQTPEAELNYYGLCMFGETDQLRALTKKFSLFT